MSALLCKFVHTGIVCTCVGDLVHCVEYSQVMKLMMLADGLNVGNGVIDYLRTYLCVSSGLI